MKQTEFMNIFPYSLQPLFYEASLLSDEIQEIRFRVNMPIALYKSGQELFISNDGSLLTRLADGRICTKTDIEEVLQYVCHDSVYAYEDEIRKGFLTIQGGHRIGIAGEVVITEEGSIKTIRNICYLNIRIAHEIQGVSDPLLSYLYCNKRLYNTLIISPPGCGKTTLLRDIIRQVSNGNTYGQALQVGVVDERSEIAGSYHGEAQKDIGIRTDILDGCPKRLGMMMLLRSMAPQVMAIDEIGGIEDIEALYHVIHSGTSIIATIHGEDIEEIKGKRHLEKILKDHIFKRFIVLGKKDGRYVITEILDEEYEECRK